MALDDITDVQLAWIAGIIDGEGCLSIAEKYGLLYVRVYACNTDKLMIDTLVSLTALGHVYLRKRGGNHKPLWDWFITSNRDILDFLVKVLPYLVVKKSRAKMCIEFCRIKLSDNPTSDKLELYYAAVSHLNERGVKKWQKTSLRLM